MKITAALDALKALAQESRLGLFRLLVQAGPDGLAVGELAERSGLAGATLTNHLHLLRRAGLVSDERRGRSIVCRAEFAQMNDLIGFLGENCCAASGDAACLAPTACVPAGKKSRP